MSNMAKLVLETVEGSGLRFGVQAGSGTESRTDSGPGMVAPNPAELLLVALGGCGAMDVISILRKKRQGVTRYQVEVTGDRRDQHPRAFTRIGVVHRLWGRDLRPAAVEEAIHLSDTKYCSVRASLHPGIEITSRYELMSENPEAPPMGTPRNEDGPATGAAQPAGGKG